jgi:hypothetical protein
MLRLAKTTAIVAGCIGSLTLSGSARAEFFDFDPGMEDPFSPNTAYSDGHPYDWYYQQINLDFFNYTDGRENTLYVDSPEGNIPYIILDGTDYSTAGHCLQVSFGGPNQFSSPNGTSSPVQQLRFSYLNSSGTDEIILPPGPTSGAYSVVRMWIQNTGGGLYWKTKIADLDGNNGSWSQSATMNIWRLDLNQANCTTSEYETYGVWFVTFIGTTGNYQACNQYGACVSGG